MSILERDDLPHQPPARLRSREGAGRADRPPAGRLAAGHPQGAGRQRPRRLRGGRHRAGDRGHGRRATGITRRRQRPRHAGEDGRGHPRLPVRVSSREAYVSPTRGAQGNALKTIVAMPFVLDGERGPRSRSRPSGVAPRDRLRASTASGRSRRSSTRSSADATVRTGTTDQGPLAGFSLLNPRRREGPVFTNRRRLHLAQPAPDARPSTGSASSLDDRRRPIRPGRSGGRPTRRRRTGTRPRTSSGWSPPTSRTMRDTAGCAPCASSSPSSAACSGTRQAEGGARRDRAGARAAVRARQRQRRSIAPRSPRCSRRCRRTPRR